MKTKSIIKTAFALAGFSALALMAGAQAQVINVNFVDGIHGQTLNGTSWSSTVTPLAYTGSTVNDDLGTSASSLLTSTGGVTTVGYSLTNVYGYDYSGTSTDAPEVMLQHYYKNFVGSGVGSGDGSMTLTITGLTDGTNYNLAFVSDQDLTAYEPDKDGGIFSIAGQTTQTSTGEPSSPTETFDLGLNYVDFASVQSTGGQIVVNIGQIGAFSEAALNGFQIEAAVADVPEPSTMALLGLGALGLTFLIRRHRTA